MKKEKIIGILNAKTKRAEILDGGYYSKAIEEDNFEDIAESIVKLCNLQNDNDSALWKEKLKALIDGLEIENKEKLLNNGDVENHITLGEVMASRVKQLKYCW